MSSPLNKIVIIGGGGNLGAMILRGLLAVPDNTVTAIKRQDSKSAYPEAKNLKVIESDFSHDSLVSAFKGHNVVISAVGAEGIQQQKPYVDAAVAAGIKRFMPSEFGINGQSKVVQQMTPFFACKQELLDYLVEKEKAGLTWTGLVVGALLDWCIGNGFMGFDIAAKKATVWDDGKTVFSATNEDDLGNMVAAVLQHPEETKNKFVYADSVATSQAEVLAALEKATSTKWEAEYKSSDERMAEAGEQLSKGDFTGALTTVKTTVWGSIPGLNQHFEATEKDKLMNDLLAIPRADVQATVDRVVASAK